MECIITIKCPPSSTHRLRILNGLWAGKAIRLPQMCQSPGCLRSRTGKERSDMWVKERLCSSITQPHTNKCHCTGHCMIHCVTDKQSPQLKLASQYSSQSLLPYTSASHLPLTNGQFSPFLRWRTKEVTCRRSRFPPVNTLTEDSSFSRALSIVNAGEDATPALRPPRTTRCEWARIYFFVDFFIPRPQSSLPVLLHAWIHYFSHGHQIRIRRFSFR